jgi:hypothetical protein
MQQQLWNARKPDGTLVSTLLDGLKYLLGVKWLPTGWEIGWVPKYCTVHCTGVCQPCGAGSRPCFRHSADADVTKYGVMTRGGGPPPT